MAAGTVTNNDIAYMGLHVRDHQTFVNDVTPKPVTKLIAALINIAFVPSGSKFLPNFVNNSGVPVYE